MQRVTSGLLAVLVLVAVVVPAIAQEDEKPIGVWQHKFELALNLLQSTYSQNWNGGDKGSVVWAGSFKAELEKRYNEAATWRNKLNLAYGQTHKQERDAGGLYWTKPDKTDDIIDFESLLRWSHASGWGPFVAFNFKSMFDDRSDPENRSLQFNPMSFEPSAGIARKFVDTEERKLLGRVGVAYIYNSRRFFLNVAPSTETQRAGSSELAATAVIEYKVGALDKRVDWESRLALLLPFLYTGKSVFEDGFTTTGWIPPDDIAGYTTTLDVDWENTFTANITSVISVKLFLRWVYDKYDNTVTPVVENGILVNEVDVELAIRKAGQFKQTMALAFGYTF